MQLAAREELNASGLYKDISIYWLDSFIQSVIRLGVPHTRVGRQFLWLEAEALTTVNVAYK